ncbi:hypothetical protein PPERSA_08578 [Pseudocohnilembus persalinus]|uniref:ADP-ribosylation factor-like protein 2-binding protein n=1 Tax=Pseudocohnilembus persalinus TaxID=266149 RepID=A0A0V0R6P2_PSEPJ|nr:hypothetical protein PPERSA_08578 [Pseudocohnilembus persalinus]|eukprot:KRX10175.1 hypothetical protein PPERSA_08578 [Pseudocohnilembus persalinus]
MEDEEEFEIANYDGNQEDQEFDNIIGCLQDIVISQEFELLQQQFFKKHYQVFEDTEENKMEYMTIFKQYQQEIESYIEKQLMEMIEGFDIDILLDLLQEREDQIDESLLDLLYSFTDFEKFKAFILDYKKEFEEIERIEKLKTIKQTTKKTLNKANNIGNQKNTGNIFADNSKNKNLFSNKDPLAELIGKRFQ